MTLGKNRRKRLGTGLVCARHRKAFVRFGGDGARGSWGCPACVEAIREDVRRDLNGSRRRPRGRRVTEAAE